MVYKKSHRAGRKRRERILELRKQGILIAPVISNHSLTNYKEAVAELQHLERLHAVEREAQGASYGSWKCTSMPINAAKTNLQNGAQGKNSTTCLSTVVSNDTDDFSSNLDFVTLKTEPPDEYIDISDKCTLMPINAMTKINLQNGAQGKNSTTCLSTVVSDDTGDFSSNLDFCTALKTEPPDECIDISDTDDVAIEQQRVNVVADENRNASPSVTNDCIPDRMLQNRGENGNQNCARTDVELMREEINILQEQALKQIQERRNEIEEEKLKILRENLALKKAKFEYYKISNLEYKDIFISIDKNLKCLKDKVEKLVPSYLK